MLSILLAAGTATAAIDIPTQTFDGDVYAATPAGWVLSHCITDLPEGATVSRVSETETNIILVTGETVPVPLCRPKVNRTNPTLRRNSPKSTQPPTTEAEEGQGQGQRQVSQLPPDYDGWLQYTAANYTPGFDVMTNAMSVPDLPKKLPQILYFFPGLQNIDWIPKVDPEPVASNPFDIIQPVLQYPGSTPKTWGVRSWYVTINAGALRSTMLDTEQGDSVFCNMTRTGPESWFIGSRLNSGKETNQRVNAFTPGALKRLRVQPWAYVTLECYGCDGCGTYPTEPIVFSDIKLSSNGVPFTPRWVANPKPEKPICNEATDIAGPDKVTISFQ